MWFTRSKPLAGENFLRTASPNERRCIAREALGFYPALVVGGIYEFSESVEVASVFTYVHALRGCVRRHPMLSSSVADSESNSPYYEFCPRLDLNRHVEILEPNDEGDGETKAIESVLPDILDAAWPASIPAWRIVVLPLSEQRCFIAFSYSHALGDGMSGFAFHRSFLQALDERQLAKDLICQNTLKQISPPFDTPRNLPISWSYLLSPLLATYLPKPIASLFGLKAALNSVTPGTWTASPMFYDPKKHRTAIQTISIDAESVAQVLKICRSHDSKLTGLLHQFIATALSESLPEPNNFDNFVAATPLSMRGPIGVSKDEIGNFTSADMQSFPIKKPPNGGNDGEVDWALAKSTTKKLATAAKTLKDQPVGLLRYLNDIHGWTSSKLGQPRDCSYELSNIASFQPAGPTMRCAVVGMVFCQPANVTGPPLKICALSVANGPLNIAVSWQVGALGLPSQHDESAFVGDVCQKIHAAFDRLVSISEN